jgi:hypothetical protein
MWHVSDACVVGRDLAAPASGDCWGQGTVLGGKCLAEHSPGFAHEMDVDLLQRVSVQYYCCIFI